MSRSGSAPLLVVGTRNEREESRDDFFCLRYQVSYPSFDCAFRTRYETAPGCAGCDQGRFNLKRHREALILAGYTRPSWLD